MFDLVLSVVLVGFVATSPDPDFKIAGGYDIDIKEAPYQVSIMYKGSHLCGGTILEYQVIITAGNCVLGHRPKDLKIRAGSSSVSSGGQVIPVKDIAIHPNFDSKTYDYDIALLWLSTSLVYNDRVSRIAMFRDDEDVPNGKLCSVTGWGQIAYGKYPKTLQKVLIPKVKTEVCNSLYNSSNILTPRMLCAGEKGKGPCKFMVGLSPQLAAFSIGGSVIFPTLLLQQLKANDSTIHLDIDTASWIGSIYGISGMPAVLMPMIMQWKGRKWSFILICSFILIGWLLSYIATTLTGILAGESFHGLGTNSLFQVGFMGMSEMISPKYRLFSMQLFGLCQVLGMAVCGIGGRFLHYKTIGIIMLVPAVVAILVTLMWPESPHWLACKGRFDKCEEVFTWLRGNDEKSSKELAELITAQKENYRVQVYRERFTFKKFWEQITSREFYLPSFHGLLLLTMLYGSGGDVVLIYFFEMIEQTTKNENATLYAAIILYSILICGIIITKVLAKYFKNKTILFISTFGVICCLASISIVTYLQTLGILTKESNLVMYLLIAFMICNSLGLNCFVFFVSSELMPVKHRNIGGAFLIICNCSLYALTLKIAPYLLHYIDMWGTFLLFTINGIVCLFLMCKYVPETKSRTLQEIEDFYVYGRFIERRIDIDNIDREYIDVIDKSKD